jgi:hypothetical protein
MKAAFDISGGVNFYDALASADAGTEYGNGISGMGKRLSFVHLERREKPALSDLLNPTGVSSWRGSRS